MDDLEEAIGILQNAVADMTLDSTRSTCLGSLARALNSKYELTGDKKHLDAVMGIVEDVLSSKLLNKLDKRALFRVSADLLASNT